MSIGTPQYEEFTGFAPHVTVGPMRAANYWQLEEGAPFELIRGRFIMSPSPSSLHQIVLFALSPVFHRAQDLGDGLAMVAPMDVILSDDTIVQPDLLYIAKDRHDILKDRIHGAPDVIVEILSPGTARRDKIEKLDLYAKYDVAEYWVVDPSTQVIEFLILDQGKYVVQPQPNNGYQSPRLPEIKIDLAAFWAEIEKRLPSSKRS